jgi:hypothetical protein
VEPGDFQNRRVFAFLFRRLPPGSALLWNILLRFFAALFGTAFSKSASVTRQSAKYQE